MIDRLTRAFASAILLLVMALNWLERWRLYYRRQREAAALLRSERRRRR